MDPIIIFLIGFAVVLFVSWLWSLWYYYVHRPPWEREPVIVTRPAPPSSFSVYELGLEHHKHCQHRVYNSDWLVHAPNKFCPYCTWHRSECTFYNGMCGACVAKRVYFLQRFWRAQRRHARLPIRRLREAEKQPYLMTGMCIYKSLRERVWTLYTEHALHPDSPYMRRFYVRKGDPPYPPALTGLANTNWHATLRGVRLPT